MPALHQPLNYFRVVSKNREYCQFFVVYFSITYIFRKKCFVSTICLNFGQVWDKPTFWVIVHLLTAHCSFRNMCVALKRAFRSQSLIMERTPCFPQSHHSSMSSESGGTPQSSVWSASISSAWYSA